MVSTRFLIASIALLAVPLASAAPAPAAAPEPVEVYGCFNGGVTIVVLGTVSAECVGSTSGQPVAEPCGEPGQVAYRVAAGPVDTGCVVVLESYFCPGGGGYFVVLETVQVGECRPCCDPSPLAASAADPPVEFTQCDTWGTGVAVYGKEVVCITTGCSPVCTTAAAGPNPFPLVRVEQCPDPSNGDRVTVAGVVVRECPGWSPAAVDLRCQDPAYGVQVYLGGKAVTTCVPLPHGV